MNKFTKAFRRGEKGFKIIEILIVIVILGILAAVAIPQVTKFIRQGKVSAANSELALVKTAIGAALADGQTANIGTPGTISSTADVNVVAYNATGPVLGIWVGDYIQGATGAGTARSAGGNGSTGETAIPITGTYTINTNGNITAASYTGVSSITAIGGAFK